MDVRKITKKKRNNRMYVLRNVADLNLLRLDPNPQIIPNIVTQLHYQLKKKTFKNIFGMHLFLEKHF